MTVRAALGRALREFYGSSWKLLVLNSAVTAVMSVVVLVVSAYPLVLFVAPLVAGPLVAALVHCTLVLIREEEFHFADAFEGLRRFWLRGFALGALFGFALLLGVIAVSFYTSSDHRALPLALLAVYVIAIVCLVILVAWPLAIDSEVSLGSALREAWLLALRAPLRLLTLGAVLLAINMLGAVTVMPLLTLTIAYSFLATAHVVLPQAQTLGEVTPSWQR